MIEIRKYRTDQGQAPFDLWLGRIADQRAKAKVKTRLDRLAKGNEGDWKSVGEGVRELRIPEGKGYRVYYAWDGDAIVILLCGGSKSRQSSDIKKAQEYWRDYHE